jgi:hypothetical protein
MENDKNAEFLRQQLGQAIQSYRSALTVLVQIMTVLIIANVTIWGYAINYKTAGLIFIGAIFPLLTIYLFSLVGRLLSPIVFTAYHAEKQMSRESDSSLMRLGISVLSGEKFISQLEKISDMESRPERLEKLRKLNFLILGHRQGIANSILVLISILQLIAPFLLSSLFGWPIFER